MMPVALVFPAFEIQSAVLSSHKSFNSTVELNDIPTSQPQLLNSLTSEHEANNTYCLFAMKGEFENGGHYISGSAHSFLMIFLHSNSPAPWLLLCLISKYSNRAAVVDIRAPIKEVCFRIVVTQGEVPCT